MGGAVSVGKEKSSRPSGPAAAKQGATSSNTAGSSNSSQNQADNTLPTVVENQSSIIDLGNHSSVQSSPRGGLPPTSSGMGGIVGSGFFRSPYLYAGGSRSASNSSQGNSSPNRIPAAASPSAQSGSSGSPLDSPYHARAGMFHYRTADGGPSDADIDDDEEAPRPINGDEADMFLQTALSLGMDNEDLLFNMMFFDEGHAGTFGAMLNTMQTETLALHSENNTPYKLNPANDKAKSSLIEEVYSVEVHRGGDEDGDCAVCKDDLEQGCAVLRIPTCRHFFHQECLLRWITLQAWCPVCRSALDERGSHPIGLDSVSEVPLDEHDPTGEMNTFTPRGKMHISRKLEFEEDTPLEVGVDDIADQKMMNRKQQHLHQQLQAYAADEKSSAPCEYADDKGYDSSPPNLTPRAHHLQVERAACHDSAEKIVQHALQSFCHKEVMSKD